MARRMMEWRDTRRPALFAVCVTPSFSRFRVQFEYPVCTFPSVIILSTALPPIKWSQTSYFQTWNHYFAYCSCYFLSICQCVLIRDLLQVTVDWWLHENSGGLCFKHFDFISLLSVKPHHKTFKMSVMSDYSHIPSPLQTHPGNITHLLCIDGERNKRSASTYKHTNTCVLSYKCCCHNPESRLSS